MHPDLQIIEVHFLAILFCQPYKRRYCIRITVPYNGIGDVAVGLDGGALLDGGDEQDL